MVLKTSFLFLAIAVLTGCSAAKKEEYYNEYVKRYSEAEFPFADEDKIVSTIAYMDEIIAKDSNKNIKSIYYDKARLLFRLKRYNEALEELFKTDDYSYDIYKATLFIRLGRNGEAAPYLQRSIEGNKKGLLKSIARPDNKKNPGEINFYTQGLMALYIFADKTYESILYELTSENIMAYNEAEVLLQELLFVDNAQGDMQKVKEIILLNMWPE